MLERPQLEVQAGGPVTRATDVTDAPQVLAKALGAKRRRDRRIYRTITSLLLFFVPALIAFALSNAQASTYRATADLAIGEPSLGADRLETLMAASKVRADSPAFLAGAAAEIGVTPEDLGSRATAEILELSEGGTRPVSTNILRLTIHHDDPQVAVIEANLLADRFVDAMTPTERLMPERSSVVESIQQLQPRRLAAWNAVAAATGEEPEAEQALAIARYQGLVDDLAAQVYLLDQIDASNTSPTRVGSAFVKPQPVSLNRGTSTLIGFGVGAVLVSIFLATRRGQAARRKAKRGRPLKANEAAEKAHITAVRPQT